MRVRVLGCPIDDVSFGESLRTIRGFVASGTPHQHVAINVNKLLAYRSDATLRAAIDQCDLINVDGRPVFWASRLLRVPLTDVVPGIDLMEAVVSLAATSGWSVYFLGAREAVVRKVAEVYAARYRGLRVAGWRDGYWHEAEEKEVVDGIANSGADVLFVAMSSPRKERFLHQHRGRLRVPFAMGVGGAFDVVAGRTLRAPRWMRSTGLEWFWRFLSEPRRMWKRYFWDGLAFLPLVVREWFAVRSGHATGSGSPPRSGG